MTKIVITITASGITIIYLLLYIKVIDHISNDNIHDKQSYDLSGNNKPYIIMWIYLISLGSEGVQAPCSSHILASWLYPSELRRC